MSKPKSEKQAAYDARRAEQKAKAKQTKAETDAVFADEDAQVTNTAPTVDKKAERAAAAQAKKDQEAKVKAQRAAEKTQRIQDDKDRAARVKIDKEQKAIAKAKAKEEKLAAQAKARAEREANKVPRRHTEASLVEKYGDRIVLGSLRFETEGVWGGKQTVEINTWGMTEGVFDGNKRRIATSDLFQVFHTEETLAAIRRVRAKEARASKKAKSA